MHPTTLTLKRVRLVQCEAGESREGGEGGEGEEGRHHAVRTARFLGVFAFVVSNMSFVCVALTSLLIIGNEPFGTGTGGDGHMALPDGAMCLRVRRSADYTAVLLPIGKPVREARLLLRLDKVVDDDPLWILSSANEQSSLLNCSGEFCLDAGLVQKGTTGQFRRARIAFRYSSSSADASFAGRWLGLKGEMAMRRGMTYWLGTSRVCWAPTASSKLETTEGICLDTASGSLIANSTQGLAPTCPDARVQVFPLRAALESTWLALGGSFLRENAPDTLDVRRTHAEMGTRCGPSDSPYARDCSAAGTCVEGPSATYRRFSSRHSLVLSTNENEATLVLAPTPSLGRLPGILKPGSAFQISLARLALTLLVSVVAYVRRSQQSSDSLGVVLRSWKRASGSWACRGVQTENNSIKSVVVDALIGLLAIGSRLSVVLLMNQPLRVDGLGVVVVWEIIGSLASLCHFLLRHPPFGLELDLRRELPVTKLGGSMALLDSAAAILVSFASPPLFGSHHGYEGLGRMLSALLLCVSALPLAVFASVSCGLLAGGLYHDTHCNLRMHASFLFASMFLWAIQLASTSITVAHVFCRIFSFQVFRVHDGGHTTMSILLLCACFATSIPTQNKIVLDLSNGIAKEGQKAEPIHA